MKIVIDIDDNLYTRLFDNGVDNYDDAVDMAKAIRKGTPQVPKTEQFAKWVAREIFDENWEYNKDAFAELACRKLAKLGIIRANGDKWELLESQKSEE